MGDHSMDQIFQEGLNTEQNFGSGDKGWSQLEIELNRQKPNRKVFLLIGLLCVGLISIGSIFLLNGKTKSQVQISNNSQEHQKSDEIEYTPETSSNLIVEGIQNSKSAKSARSAKSAESIDKANNLRARDKDLLSIQNISKQTKESAEVNIESGKKTYQLLDIQNVIAVEKTDQGLNEKSPSNGDLGGSNIALNDVSSNYSDQYAYNKNEVRTPFEDEKLDAAQMETQLNNSQENSKTKEGINKRIQMEVFKVPTLDISLNATIEAKIGQIPFFEIQERIIPFRSKKWDIGIEFGKLQNTGSFNISFQNFLSPKVRFELLPKLRIGLSGFQLKEIFNLTKEDLSIKIPTASSPFYSEELLERFEANRKVNSLKVDLTYTLLNKSRFGLSVKSGVELGWKEQIKAIYHFETIYSIQSIQETFENSALKPNNWFAGCEFEYRTNLLSFYVTTSWHKPFETDYFQYNRIDLGLGVRYKL